MGFLLKLALGFLPTVLGWFGIGKKDERDVERKAGEDFGVAKTNAQNSGKQIDDARKAVDAGRAAGAADDAGGLRGQHPGDKPWDPDALG